MSRRWPRDAYAQAVWESDLKPLPRLVALAFASHAGSRDPAFAWVTYEQLVRRTGAARSSVAKAVRDLEAAGWLQQKTYPRGRVAPEYWLLQPSATRTVNSPTAGLLSEVNSPIQEPQQSDPHPVTVRHTDPRRSSLRTHQDLARASATPDTSNFPHHDKCNGTGWTDDPDELGPVPCLGCKPHLAPAASQ